MAVGQNHVDFQKIWSTKSQGGLKFATQIPSLPNKNYKYMAIYFIFQ